MKTKTLLFLTALMLNFTTQAQNVITVDNTPGSEADHSELQSAVSAATSGDVIYVHASEIDYGTINIDKPLTLIGYSHSDPDKKTMLDEVNLKDNASNTTISGFLITDSINAENDTGVLTNIVIENNSIVDINFSESYEGVNDMIIRGNIIYSIGAFNGWTNYTNTIISNNIFRNILYVLYHELVTVKNNIFLNGVGVRNRSSSTGDLVVQDCIFYDDTSSTNDINSAGVVYENCLTYNLGSGSYATLTGTGNLNNQNPQFVAATDDVYNHDDDYHLQAGSPAIGNGVSGDDIGIYNNVPFVFNNYGYTSGIPIVVITDITPQIVPGGTLNVSIESNSN